MSSSVIFEEAGIQVPFVHTLEEFRAWARSDRFPEQGRIDYIGGDIEVSMSPERFFSHGILKTEIAARLHLIATEEELGHVVTDRTRISNVPADLSSEPDAVFVSNAALEDGRVRLVPSEREGEEDFIEVEGSPDLVAEVVSPHSVHKDTRRLPAAYWRAGIREFWLADARGEELLFQIQHHAASGYEPAPVAPEGYQFSAVLGRWFRLRRHRNKHGRWVYRLEVKVGGLPEMPKRTSQDKTTTQP